MTPEPDEQPTASAARIWPSDSSDAPDRPIADITPAARTAVQEEAVQEEAVQEEAVQEEAVQVEAVQEEEDEVPEKTDVAAAAAPATEETEEQTKGETKEDETKQEPEEGEERWAAFAPAPEVDAPRAKQVANKYGGPVMRVLRHEWTIVGIASVLLAIFMTWPALRDPTQTIPQDIGDPTLQAWILAWGGHAVLHQPADLWNANAFFPEQYGYAFTDSLLGYAPFSLLGSGFEAALVRYNVVYVFAWALAFFGAYMLARQLGSGPAGALVAGAAYAYAPWRLSQAGHLHVLSSGGIVLALAMIARGHGWSLREGFRPDRIRPLWALGGWLVAAWQVSLGFGIGLPFGYFLAGICLVAGGTWAVQLVRRKSKPPWRLLAIDLTGGVLFAATCALMAYPYLKVAQQHPQAKRTAEYVGFFSPPWEGLFIPPEAAWLWGGKYANARAQLPWAAEMTLLPGFFVIGLAVAGLFVSIWSVRQRLFLAAGVVVSAGLALGPNGPGKGKYGYFFLYDVLPGFDAIRTSGRLIMYAILFLGILAAGAVTAFGRSARESTAQWSLGPPPGWLRAAAVVPFVLVLAEGINSIPQVIVSRPPISFSTIDGPALILPSDEITDATVQLWSTDGFPKIVNGNSGVLPPTQQAVREAAKRFPDAASVQILEDLGVRTVVVVRSRALNSEFANAIDAPIDGLGLTRTEEGDVVIYRFD
jgi:hypothetical protein